MTNQEMQKIVLRNIKDYLPNDIEWYVEATYTIKNNDQRIDVVTIKGEGDMAAMVPVDGLCEDYRNGVPIENILMGIAAQVAAGPSGHNINISAEQITDFELMRDRVIASVVNTGANKFRLENLVHREQEDLSIVYHVLVQSNAGSRATIAVSNELLSIWNITEEELYTIAMKNTKAFFPIEVKDMASILGLPIVPKNSMFVISNTDGVCGAIYMFDVETLSCLAEQLNVDSLYVFPSSIHEVIVTPDDITDPNAANQLVNDCNGKVVTEQEFLSDHAYLFDKKTMQVVSL
jgi:hypothetical protein